VKGVGIFRLRYPVVSETFIGEQAGALVRYRPTIITRSWGSDAVAPPRDAVIVGDQGTGVGARVARAAYVATGAPGLFGRRRTWPAIALVHAHFGPDATYALPLADQLGVPLVATFHGWDVTLPLSSYLRRNSLTTWRYVFRRDALRRRGAAFIAVSDYIRACVIKLGLPADRVVRLYVGVDIDRFRPLGRPAGERFILSVARHTEQKGVDALIRAFGRIAMRFPDVDLVQVGTGPVTAALRQIVAQLGLTQRVRFIGAQSHDAVRELMQRATVLALTSQTPATGQQEALGLALNEAGACGVPVVATRHGGMPEAVLDGETGILVPERDDAAIASALTTIIDDRALAARMGARGRAFVGDVFNLRTQTAALEDLYDRVSGPDRAPDGRPGGERDGAPPQVS
jgi:colanic acid/amylovoran biosynthesis glycosyltransferase